MRVSRECCLDERRNEDEKLDSVMNYAARVWHRSPRQGVIYTSNENEFYNERAIIMAEVLREQDGE